MKFDLLTFVRKNSFYVYSSLFFILWLAFLDDANLVSQFQYWQKLKQNESEITHYDQELIKVKAKEKGILNNLDALEKFGREKYLMKKEGETVFVLVDEDGELMEEVE
ncbi:MAG: cell division protein DivIC [Arcticibacterium sp.]|jgi:cell division protein DivIC